MSERGALWLSQLLLNLHRRAKGVTEDELVKEETDRVAAQVRPSLSLPCCMLACPRSELWHWLKRDF